MDIFNIQEKQMKKLFLIIILLFSTQLHAILPPFYQSVNETFYSRTIKIKLKDQEIFQNVIYRKKGVSWEFKCTEKIKN